MSKEACDGINRAEVASAGGTGRLRLVPQETREYSFESSPTANARASLLDASGGLLEADDDGGAFSITHELESGNVYYLDVSHADVSLNGSIAVTIVESE